MPYGTHFPFPSIEGLSEMLFLVELFGGRAATMHAWVMACQITTGFDDLAISRSNFKLTNQLASISLSVARSSNLKILSMDSTASPISSSAGL